MKYTSAVSVLLSLLTLSLLLAACMTETGQIETGNESTLPNAKAEAASRAAATIPPASHSSISPTSADVMSYAERKAAEEAEKRKRKGEIKMDNMTNVGVKGDLLETVMALLAAVKNKDEEAKLNLHYDPAHLTFDAVEEPFILAFTQIELDNSELEHMMDGYHFFSEAAIVKITAVKLNRQLEEVESTGKYIFVNIDDQWQVYRSY